MLMIASSPAPDSESSETSVRRLADPSGVRNRYLVSCFREVLCYYIV